MLFPSVLKPVPRYAGIAMLLWHRLPGTHRRIRVVYNIGRPVRMFLVPGRSLERGHLLFDGGVSEFLDTLLRTGLQALELNGVLLEVKFLLADF